MRRVVFGLGLAQVVGTIALVVAASLWLGASWQAGLALGGIVAMSSTAIVSKLLAERLELDAPHGRQVIGVLLFQDLAVVPLLILMPALGQPAEPDRRRGRRGARQGGRSRSALVVARRPAADARLARHRRAPPLERAVRAERAAGDAAARLPHRRWPACRMVLGAFLAGMLISETEYRFQVEEDIKPFRDVLLGLFFVTVGMMLDLARGPAPSSAW